MTPSGSLKPGFDEIRRIIREEDPPRPSTKLSTLDAAEQTAVASRRHSEPPKLIHLVRGDLDWIVMKTLEKDRNRRYETANGLAMDIQRHLNNEPVVARPPSSTYRFQKLVQRYRLAVAAVGAVTLALALGIVVSSWLAVRAKQAEREAVSAAHNETLQRTRAEGQEALVREQLYATSINVAHRAWEEGEIVRMEELLESLGPETGKEDLRGFEWVLSPADGPS